MRHALHVIAPPPRRPGSRIGLQLPMCIETSRAMPWGRLIGGFMTVLINLRDYRLAFDD
jgi:hypothetical protein